MADPVDSMVKCRAIWLVYKPYNNISCKVRGVRIVLFQN